MDQVLFSEIVKSMPATDERLLVDLSACLDIYPAASSVSFIYASLLKQLYPDKYELEKKKLLLSIVNRPTLQSLCPPESVVEIPEISFSEQSSYEPAVGLEEEHELLDELIDKFGNNAPKIKAPSEKQEVLVNYGKISCVENPELVSETLALIFAQQGYYGKAMKIYKKLCLQNPEKSCYFAAQINKLKEERNNNNKTE